MFNELRWNESSETILAKQFSTNGAHIIELITRRGNEVGLCLDFFFLCDCPKLSKQEVKILGKLKKLFDF